MMEMGLIFLNSSETVISSVRTAEEKLGPRLVVRVEPGRSEILANPDLSYLRDGSPKGVMPREASFSRRTRKVAE
jgi:hypothetical protein